MGLVWSRRKLAVKHLGYDPAVPAEETDDAAVEAGQQMRARARERLRAVDDREYHFRAVDQEETE